MKMDKDEENMLREVFRLKTDKLDKAKDEIKENPEFNGNIESMLLVKVNEEKARYLKLQNKLINTNVENFHI